MKSIDERFRIEDILAGYITSVSCKLVHMVKKYLPLDLRLLIMLLVTFVSSPCFPQWKLQTSGTQAHLSDVYFVDSLKGWAVGQSGTIIATSNGGGAWTVQRDGWKASLRRISFVDSAYGWIVGDSGTVLRTINGGSSWEKLIADFWNYSDVKFVNRSVGYMVAGEQGNLPYGTIQKTTDGGVTWDSTVGINDGVFKGVDFVSPSEGWVVGGKTYVDNFDPEIILHTTDSGETWTEQTPPTYGPLLVVKFFSPLLGCGGGDAHLSHSLVLTTNGGNEWTEVPAGSGFPVLDIAWMDSIRIWILRGNGLSFSWNRGDSWIDVTPDSGNFLGFSFVSWDKGWVVGPYGAIWKLEGAVSGIASQNHFEPKFQLHQNYPNPLNPTTTIEYKIIESGEVKLDVFDIVGKLIQTIEFGYVLPGDYSFHLSLSGHPSGVYFYSLSCKNQTITKNMILLK